MGNAPNRAARAAESATERVVPEIAAEAMDAGVSALLEKPLDPYVVVREALRWIGPARP